MTAAQWETSLMCALECLRCHAPLKADTPRVLSVFDHQPICLACKRTEEARLDYPEISKNTIGQCLVDVELQQQDPGGYCYHHFYPYRCS